MSEENYFILRNQIKDQPPSYLLQFDGGANPNPGPCAGAFVIYQMDTMDILFEGGTFLPHGTNNIGEYIGLLEGLKTCQEQHFDSLLVEGDSKLVVYQVARKWNVNHAHLQAYQKKIHEILNSFSSVTIRHIYRDKNKKADQLSDETLDKKNSWIRFNL